MSYIYNKSTHLHHTCALCISTDTNIALLNRNMYNYFLVNTPEEAEPQWGKINDIVIRHT